MAFTSFPRPDYNGGFVTEYEHELLTCKSVPDGVHGFPTDPAPVIADAGVRTVRVRAGVDGNLRGGAFQSGATDTVLPQLAANTSGSPRIDLVVARLNRSDYSITPVVITGTPAANPVAPSPVRNLGPAGFFDLPLAAVRVAHNASTIAAGDVTTKCWYLGSDGQIRCTPDSRPPFEAGRVVWEHPTGRYLVGTGSSWVTAWDDSGVTKMTVDKGFAATENSLQRRAGVAVLNLKVKRPSAIFPAGSQTKVGSLPAGFAPTFPVQSAAVWWSGGEAAALRVEPNGGVYVVTLAGIAVGADRSIDGSLTWLTAA
ncbi:hypothetical protein [Micromonospora maritima]|uniref:hypothetical protein n=1 Tax=Micromonospora maritima TaxID=986711 RepID=UPI00157D1BF6|nr:hypothetical protein [Micromonospora maritima]